jgi:hypothetical protein
MLFDFLIRRLRPAAMPVVRLGGKFAHLSAAKDIEGSLPLAPGCSATAVPSGNPAPRELGIQESIP